MAAVREQKYGEKPGFISSKNQDLNLSIYQSFARRKTMDFPYVTCSFADNYLMEGIVSRLSSSTLLGS